MKERIKEFDLARIFAILCMILVHLMYAIYDYSNNCVYFIVDFLGSPFAAPTFMFILGANTVLSKKSSKDLFKRGLDLFILSIFFNIICHSLPFYILGSINNTLYYANSALHWIGAVDILTFAGIAFMLMAFLKKIKVNNYTLIFIAISLSIINTILSKYAQIDFESNTILAMITSLFYSSSITGYFSLFGWFIFPVAGKIYMEECIKYKDSNKFHIICLVVGIIGYTLMILGQTHLIDGHALIDFSDEYSYYKMHIYGGVMNVFFLLMWINILHYVVKIIPEKHNIFITNISKNLTNIYIVQWFLINYVFVLLFNDELRVDTLGLFISFIILLILTNIFSILFRKFKIYLNK